MHIFLLLNGRAHTTSAQAQLRELCTRLTERPGSSRAPWRPSKESWLVIGWGGGHSKTMRGGKDIGLGLEVRTNVHPCQGELVQKLLVSGICLVSSV